MKAKDLLIYAVIIFVVILIRSFIVTPIKVNGDSMNNTLYNKEVMLLKKYEKKFKRFDIIVFDYEGEKLIKRIIALPKEDIKYEDGKLYINEKEIEDNYGIGVTSDFKDYCMENEYFVLGDNRENSKDSRMIGCISKDDINGMTNFVIFPFNKFGKVN